LNLNPQNNLRKEEKMIYKNKFAILTAAIIFLTLFCGNALAQQEVQGSEEYSGSFISFDGPRTATGFFNLRISGKTTDEQAAAYLKTLRKGGQEEVLRAIQKQDLGSFSINNSLGRALNFVRETNVNGQKRLFIVFERWTQFAELRGGYRSLDYPFGVIEIYFDKQGRGEGTYIAAAKIRMQDDNTVEIENFATYPVKLTNVTRTDRKPR
jgi:hypothetical protein